MDSFDEDIFGKDPWKHDLDAHVLHDVECFSSRSRGGSENVAATAAAHFTCMHNVVFV
eukprot:m.387215 g.387215  ORF g.387215 m.387215 type:complete len:58 (-) comp21027_c0_seq5:1790-1963(-)